MDTGRDWGGGGAESNADDTAWASRAEAASRTVVIFMSVLIGSIDFEESKLQSGWAVVSLCLQIWDPQICGCRCAPQLVDVKKILDR